MDILEITTIYNLIFEICNNAEINKQSRLFRYSALSKISAQKSNFVKVAFDTRRIDQTTQYNPRRGLQNYNRSESFITDNMSQKIKNFSKIRNTLLHLKELYGNKHEWQDSNARVLLNKLDNGLRVIAQDNDFSDNQPGTGSLDYLEELMYVRYRLGFDEMTKLAEPDLEKIILNKDPELLNGVDVHEITKSDVTKQNYDTLLEKLFGSVRATKDNPSVERTVTITIKDRFVE